MIGVKYTFAIEILFDKGESYMGKRPVIGVVGGGKATAPHGSDLYNLAVEVGREIKIGNAILLCGGGSGVMEAVAKGAENSQVPTVGIMPSLEEEKQYPNKYVNCAIFTGLRDGRNYINACASDIIIAMEGGPGTLSEIALALKIGKTVICLKYWEFLANAGYPLVYADNAKDAIAKAYKLIELNQTKQQWNTQATW
jgi:uncharacterized protein (TIGR00725 family)